MTLRIPTLTLYILTPPQAIISIRFTTIKSKIISIFSLHLLYLNNDPNPLTLPSWEWLLLSQLPLCSKASLFRPWGPHHSHWQRTLPSKRPTCWDLQPSSWSRQDQHRVIHHGCSHGGRTKVWGEGTLQGNAKFAREHHQTRQLCCEILSQPKVEESWRRAKGEETEDWCLH